jgi:transposase-like protein
MKSVSQNLSRVTHQIIAKRIEGLLQPGDVMALIEDQTHKILAKALNQALEEELSAALGREPHERASDGRLRNGTRAVSVPGFFGRLWLRKPVLRTATPESPLLASLRRSGKALVDSLASRFWLRGTSTRATSEELNRAFGTKLRSADVTTLTNALLPSIDAWLARPLPKDIRYLYLDALYLPAKKLSFTTKQALLVALGIDSHGRYHTLGFVFGDREDKDTWTAILKDLLNRGLNRSVLQLVVSDEHKAIFAAVADTLAIPHQLCLVHKQRNARARVAAKDRNAFMRDFVEVFWAPSRDKAMQALGQMKGRWGSRYPKAIEITESNLDHSLAFMSQPKALWKVLRTSNPVERFIRELRRRLQPAGAMMNEGEVWKLVWAVASEQERRWAGRRATGYAAILPEEQLAA